LYLWKYVQRHREVEWHTFFDLNSLVHFGKMEKIKLLTHSMVTDSLLIQLSLSTKAIFIISCKCWTWQSNTSI
jgi:hypothetical protein